MTREEAITTLEDIDKMFIGKCPHEDIDMAIEALRDVPDTNVGKWIPCDSEVSGSLIHRIAEYFREWDGSTPAPTMQVHIDDLRLIAQMNSELCALREERRKGRWIPCSDETQSDKKILDVTCGARTMWFNKNHPAAVYCDNRRETHEHLWKNAGNCRLTIEPDIMCDFTQLPFENNYFSLVVFDPPHLIKAKETSWLVKKYGKLDEMWPQMIHDGFKECMRVLKPDGVLIFKWSECDIPASRVWDAIGEKPLFGHKSGKQSRTFWACFMKLPEPYKGVE